MTEETTEQPRILSEEKKEFEEKIIKEILRLEKKIFYIKKLANMYIYSERMLILAGIFLVAGFLFRNNKIGIWYLPIGFAIWIFSHIFTFIGSSYYERKIKKA